MYAIKVRDIDASSKNVPLHQLCQLISTNDVEAQTLFVEHLSSYLPGDPNPNEALATLQKTQSSLIAGYDRGSLTQSGWEEECTSLGLDLVLVKAIDRVILDFVIGYEWSRQEEDRFGAELEQIKGFVDAIYQFCPLPIPKAGAVYVALRNIEVVCINAIGKKNSSLSFDRRSVDGVFCRSDGISGILLSKFSIFEEQRPIAWSNKKASPYLQPYQKSKIRKRLKSYEISPEIVVSVLIQPELVPLAMELYAGIEEAADLVEAVRELRGDDVTHPQILDAVDQISEYSNDLVYVVHKNDHRRREWKNLLEADEVIYVLANPELMRIAKQLRQCHRVYSSLAKPNSFQCPKWAARDFVVQVQREYGRPALSPPELKEAIAEVIESFCSAENFASDRSDFSAYDIAERISQQKMPEREREALQEIGRLLITTFHLMSTPTPDDFVQRIKQAYDRPALNQRVLNALEDSLEAAELASDILLTDLVKKVVEQLRRDDNGSAEDENIIYFDQLELKVSPSQLERLEAYIEKCWAEIESEERRYQVPSGGRALILAADFLRVKLNLSSLQFIQERIDAPGVFVKFKFSFDSRELDYLLKIGTNGYISGFHAGIKNKGIQAIIVAVAVSYYRDLVLPGSIYEPQSSRQAASSQSEKAPSVLKRPRKLPRPQVKQTNNEKDFRAWHIAQERARHDVYGFRRWVRDGYRAPHQKQMEAKEAAGVVLPLGYTWVNKHSRGVRTTGDDSLQIDSKGGLSEETIFSPPERASDELYMLLSERE